MANTKGIYRYRYIAKQIREWITSGPSPVRVSRATRMPKVQLRIGVSQEYPSKPKAQSQETDRAFEDCRQL